MKFIQALVALYLFVAFYGETALSQCTEHRVLHTSGTEQVGCRQVTVAADGATQSAFFSCFSGNSYGPFWVGNSGTGSYTFTFSAPIDYAKFELFTIDNYISSPPNVFNEERVRFEVNGSFYPIGTTGTFDGCEPQPIILPPGVLASSGGQAGAKDIIIPGPITTLKIEDEWLVGLPLGVPFNLYFCCLNCTSEAGEIPFNGDLTLCSTDLIAIVPPSINTNLDANDVLQYILYSDPNDIAGSIVAVSNTPEFPFNPVTMMQDVFYHIVAVVGNQVNGNVDLNDPCLSVSIPVDVIWRTPPTVALLLNDPCITPGECYPLSLLFTGYPPFQLSGQVVSGNSVLVSFGGTYFSFSEEYTLCLPANTPFGDLTVAATSLADAFCTCE